MKIAKNVIGEVEKFEHVYIHDFISPKDAKIIGEQLFSIEIYNLTIFKNSMFSTIFPMHTTTLESLTVIESSGSTANADTIDDTYFFNIRKIVDDNKGLVELNVDKLSTLHNTQLIKKNRSRKNFKFNFSDETHLKLYVHSEQDSITMAINTWEQLMALNMRATTEQYITIIAESESVFEYRFPFFMSCSGQALSVISTKNVDTLTEIVLLSKRMRNSKWNTINLQSPIDFSNPALCIEIGKKVQQLQENLLYVARISIHFPKKPSLPLPLSLHARLLCGIDSENSYRADLKKNTVTCFVKSKHEEILTPPATHPPTPAATPAVTPAVSPPASPAARAGRM